MDFRRQTPRRGLTNTPAASTNRPHPSHRIQKTLPKKVVKIEGYEYSEENVLGQGYSSKVYLGRGIEEENMQYAIKVVDKRRLSKDILFLLKQEIEVHRQLHHPNIVKCHDVIERGYFYYFILQYCPHGTLQSYIKKQGRLTESKAVSVMEQILAAYRYLLENKVLHRDLKPPNILKVGNTWKICDFGFSIIGKKNFAGEVNVGTPSYMAPESLDRSYYSHKTDIFSLGVLCYEMLFGTTPWQHKNEKVLSKLMNETPLRSENIDSLNNQKLVEFLKKACQPFERKRMGIAEIQEFSFSTEGQLIEEVKADVAPRLFAKVTPSDKIDSKATCPSQVSTVSTVKASSRENVFQGNCLVVEREMYYARLLFSILQHSQGLGLVGEHKEMLFAVLSRHANYILRRVKHPRLNFLGLRKWQEFSKAQQFEGYCDEAVNLAKQIEALTTKEIKRRTIVIIRQVNKAFDDLTYDKHVSKRCLDALKKYVGELTFNRFQVISQKQGSKITVGQRRVLESLLAYFNYLRELSVSYDESRSIAVKGEYKMFGTLLEEQNPRSLSIMEKEMQTLNS